MENKMQVISSSKIVRRDSSVGSAIRGFQGPADRAEPEQKMRPLRDVRAQHQLANSRNNSRMSNKAPN